MSMWEYIVAALVGALCIVIGIMNIRGHIGMLHSYHRNRVSEEDRLPFGRLVGLGMIIIGVVIIIGGALYTLAEYTENKAFAVVGTVLILLGLAVGVGIAFYAMKKYNKGIF